MYSVTFDVVAVPDNKPTILPELRLVAVNVEADPVIPVTLPLVMLAVPLNVPENVVVERLLVLGLKVNPLPINDELFPVEFLSVKLR